MVKVKSIVKPIIFLFCFILMLPEALSHCCPGPYCGPYYRALNDWASRVHPNCYQYANKVKELREKNIMQIVGQNFGDDDHVISYSGEKNRLFKNPTCPGPCCPTLANKHKSKQINANYFVKQLVADYQFKYCNDSHAFAISQRSSQAAKSRKENAVARGLQLGIPTMDYFTDTYRREAVKVNKDTKTVLSLQKAIRTVENNPHCPGPCCPKPAKLLSGEEFEKGELTKEIAAELLLDTCNKYRA